MEHPISSDGDATDPRTEFDHATEWFSDELTNLSVFVTASFEGLRAGPPRAMSMVLEAAIVLVVSDLEQYLKSVVGTAAFLRASQLRSYWERSVQSPADLRRVQRAEQLDLNRFAEGQVELIKNKGRRLNRIFAVLLEFGPWPNDEAASRVRDLCRVRNQLVHAGSRSVRFAEEDLAFENTGWLKKPITAASARPQGRPLVLERLQDLLAVVPLVRDGLQAVNDTLQHHIAHFRTDRRWYRQPPLRRRPIE